MKAHFAAQKLNPWNQLWNLLQNEMIKNSIQIDRNSNLLSVPSVEAPKANSEKKGICLSRQVRFISSAYFLCISFSLSILIVLIFVVVNSIYFLNRRILQRQCWQYSIKHWNQKVFTTEYDQELAGWWGEAWKSYLVIPRQRCKSLRKPEISRQTSRLSDLLSFISCPIIIYIT